MQCRFPLPEEIDPASAFWWTLWWTFSSTSASFLSAWSCRHLSRPCVSAGLQPDRTCWCEALKVLQRSQNCYKPLVEAFRTQEGVVCSPNEETEPSLWQFHRTLPSWLLGSQHPPKLSATPAAPVPQTSFWAPPTQSRWPLQYSHLPLTIGWVGCSIRDLPAIWTSSLAPKEVEIILIPSNLLMLTADLKFD